MCDYNSYATTVKAAPVKAVATVSTTPASGLKQLSKDVVNTVSEFLILTFGKTTTLDIKNNLRKLGFEATQKAVSDLMDEIVTRWDKDYDYAVNGAPVKLTYENTSSNGRFRVYSFATVGSKAVAAPAVAAVKAAPVAKAPVATTAAASIKDPKSYIRRNMSVSSATLAKTLGISVGSVAAYKANINR